MRNILLTRQSHFQIFCANSLYFENIITDVIVEKGASISMITKRNVLQKIVKNVNYSLLFNPIISLRKFQNFINHKKYYGNRDFHNKRLFKKDYETFNSGIELHNVENVNDKDTIAIIKNLNPDLIYVFGTRMISSKIIGMMKCPIVNMHWGLSPKYRGEGIVTALAKSGMSDVGVTIHLLDRTSDGGDIIFQGGTKIDVNDNFYSIGLKLTKIGITAFKDVFQSFLKNKGIMGKKQDLTKGKLYGSIFMKKHPEILSIAWKKLCEEKLCL